MHLNPHFLLKVGKLYFVTCLADASMSLGAVWLRENKVKISKLSFGVLFNKFSVLL